MYTSTLLQYAREQLLEGSSVFNDSDISTSSSFTDSNSSVRSITNGSSDSSSNSFLNNRQLPVRRESLDELIASTDASDSLPSSPRSAPYFLHEDHGDDTVDHSNSRSRAGLRDVIIHSGVGTTEL